MTVSASRILPLIDLTSLNETDTQAGIRNLCDRAVSSAGSVAAVCVYPRFVKLAREVLAQASVRIATVVNFPSGEAAAEAVAAETTAAVCDVAHEIDLVFPYGAFLDGQTVWVKAVLDACRAACGSARLKVILESGAFSDLSMLKQAAEMCVEAGADFLKTSTGKRQPGATLEAAEVMLKVCRDAGRPVGFKASGGIRDVQTASAYIALAESILGVDYIVPQTFRFGASGLLDSVLNELAVQTAPVKTVETY